MKLQLNDGNQMPFIGLGTYSPENVDVSDIITYAIECGYRCFDCAHMYRNQQTIGDSLNKAIADGKVTREELFITTKVWPTWYGEGRVIQSAKNMAQEMGLKYFDLLLLHWPIVFKDSDTETFPTGSDGIVIEGDRDIADVYKELEEVKRLGLDLNGYNKH